MPKRQGTRESSDVKAGKKGRRFSFAKRWLVRIALFLVAYLVSMVILLFERNPSIGGHEFVIGEPAPRTLFCPLDLTFVNEEATRIKVDEQVAAVLPVYRVNSGLTREIASKADRFFEAVHKAKQDRQANKPAVLEHLPITISQVSLDYLLGDIALEEVRKNLELLFEEGLKPGIMDEKTKSEIMASGKPSVQVADSSVWSGPVNVQIIPTPKAVFEKLNAKISDTHWNSRIMKKVVFELFDAVVAPNMTLDAAATSNLRAQAAKNTPAVEDKIKKDELLVQRGMLVTGEDKKRIDEVQKKVKKQKELLKFSAIALLVFLTYGFCFVYLFSFEKKVFGSIRMMILVPMIFVLTLLFCRMVRDWPSSSPYLMPFALAPLLMSLLVSTRFGLMGAGMSALLAAPLAGFGPDILMTAFFGGAAGTFASLRVRRRFEFLRIGLVLGGAMFAALFAFQLFREYSLWEAFSVGLLGFANGLLITIPLLFILLPLFEYFFGLATDVTLLELSDLNQPLLKRMVLEAPGTYHHSLVVSRLAEAGCAAIKANVLMARVGSYFHDIGKMARPEYFIENLLPNFVNRHDALPPAESAGIIIRHIEDGIALARKHKLKDCIARFIPEHHGNGIVYYFFRKALDQASPGERIDPGEFRYPGPKPQSRETAVVMLADSVEAASRSLESPTPEALRNLIRKIINDKFIDSQLDECDLTLRDLFKIQESFVANLMAIYHTRVAYPAVPQVKDKPDLFMKGEYDKFRRNSD